MKCVAVVVACVMALARPAFADRVDDLAKTLGSSSEKARIEAVLSLAKLADVRTLKPLVAALHDPSAQVRAIAATALGQLGHKAALPSLRAAATDDTDDAVRKRARVAAAQVAKANHLPDELAAQDVQAKQAHHGSGFGRSPHAVSDRPDLYVVVKSSNDDSPGKADKTTRQTHAEIVKQSLVDQFQAAPQVTMTQADAQRWGLDPRHLDLSVVKLEVANSGGYVEVEAELRLAISDENGKMLSFLSGGAKVQVPRAKFNASLLPQIRREALESAMKGMFDKLLAHLRETSQS